MIVRVTSRLDVLVSATPENSEGADVEMDDIDARECNIAYAWDLLNSLLTVIEAKVKQKHMDVGKYYEELMPRLLGLVVRASQQKVGESGEPLFKDRRLVAIVSKIEEKMIWELGAEYVDCFNYLRKLQLTIWQETRETVQPCVQSIRAGRDGWYSTRKVNGSIF